MFSEEPENTQTRQEFSFSISHASNKILEHHNTDNYIIKNVLAEQANKPRIVLTQQQQICVDQMIFFYTSVFTHGDLFCKDVDTSNLLNELSGNVLLKFTHGVLSGGFGKTAVVLSFIEKCAFLKRTLETPQEHTMTTTTTYFIINNVLLCDKKMYERCLGLLNLKNNSTLSIVSTNHVSERVLHFKDNRSLKRLSDYYSIQNRPSNFCIIADSSSVMHWLCECCLVWKNVQERGGSLPSVFNVQFLLDVDDVESKFEQYSNELKRDATAVNLLIITSDLFNVNNSKLSSLLGGVWWSGVFVDVRDYLKKQPFHLNLYINFANFFWYMTDTLDTLKILPCFNRILFDTSFLNSFMVQTGALCASPHVFLNKNHLTRSLPVTVNVDKYLVRTIDRPINFLNTHEEKSYWNYIKNCVLSFVKQYTQLECREQDSSFFDQSMEHVEEILKKHTKIGNTLRLATSFPNKKSSQISLFDRLSALVVAGEVSGVRRDNTGENLQTNISVQEPVQTRQRRVLKRIGAGSSKKKHTIINNGCDRGSVGEEAKKKLKKMHQQRMVKCQRLKNILKRFEQVKTTRREHDGELRSPELPVGISPVCCDICCEESLNNLLMVPPCCTNNLICLDCLEKITKPACPFCRENSACFVKQLVEYFVKSKSALAREYDAGEFEKGRVCFFEELCVKMLPSSSSSSFVFVYAELEQLEKILSNFEQLSISPFSNQDIDWLVLEKQSDVARNFFQIKTKRALFVHYSCIDFLPIDLIANISSIYLGVNLKRETCNNIVERFLNNFKSQCFSFNLFYYFTIDVSIMKIKC